MSDRRCHPFDLDALTVEEQDRQAAADERAAELDAAQAADPRERDRAEHEADLREEYSRPEYHEDGDF